MMSDISDVADAAGRLTGIDMALLRGMFGPDSVAMVGFILVLVVFFVTSLAVAILVSMLVTRVVGRMALNSLHRRLKGTPLLLENGDEGKSSGT